jgi:hypothetical protein
MTEDQLRAYLGGFFDGEGCITSVVQGKYGSVTLRCYVGQKDRRPLDLFAARYGGTVDNAKSNGVWVWQAAAVAARACLLDLSPFLIVKQAQAVIALELYEATRSRRTEIHFELQRLKRVV